MRKIRPSRIKMMPLRLDNCLIFQASLALNFDSNCTNVSFLMWKQVDVGKEG